MVLSNWLPTTLLNVDCKILARAIAKRIQTKMPKLIHSDQAGFVKGRYIGQNVRLLRAPVCKNQTYRGKGGKFDFFHILMFDGLGYN